jgi:hypothetical protein
MKVLEGKLKQEMELAHSLTQEVKSLDEKIQHHSNLVSRASNVYIPYIRGKLEEARDFSGEADAKLPEILRDLHTYDEIYQEDKLKAERLRSQLQWLVSRWYSKLWKVMTLQVRGKRRKLFRIVLPVAIVLVVVLAILLAASLVIYLLLPILLPILLPWLRRLSALLKWT